MGFADKLNNMLRIKNVYLREAFAEFLGTMILVAIGDAAVAQNKFAQKDANASGQSIDPLSIHFGWGLAIMAGVFVCGGVSGGHINPAVTLAMATVGKFPFRKVPIYIISQYLGGFFGALLVFLVYRNAITTYDPEMTLFTAGIFATYPQSWLSAGNGLGDQIFATAILVSAACAITDNKNMNAPKGLIPLMIGLVVSAIGMCYGYNCGYPINPARDLAPRIFTSIAGWGSQVFSVHDYNYWWIPLVGPHIGAVVGAWVYKLFIEAHWPEDEEEGHNMSVQIVNVSPSSPEKSYH